MTLDRYDWGRLNHLQVGRYGEYHAKMEFTLYGFDVYTAEVDDKGIDFVVRRSSDEYLDIQVKTVRGLNYVFFRKAVFSPRERLLATLVLLPPLLPAEVFLIPSTAWLEPNSLFVGRDYECGDSAPEWGLNLSNKNLPLLEPYRFATAIEMLQTRGRGS